jgi:hypothetical protein
LLLIRWWGWEVGLGVSESSHTVDLTVRLAFELDAPGAESGFTVKKMMVVLAHDRYYRYARYLISLGCGLIVDSFGTYIEQRGRKHLS